MPVVKEKQLIPRYTLEQTSEQGHTSFEVRKAVGAVTQKKEMLFQPHRKDYYFFFLATGGISRHWIDFISYDVRPGNMYFTVPQQVHLKERGKPIDGICVAFTEEFLSLGDLRSFKDLAILQNPDNRHELLLSAADVSFLENILDQMLAEFQQQQDWQSSMLQSYLKIFLVHLSRLYVKQFPADVSASAGQQLVKRMKSLLDEHYASLHQVSDYARELNVTPGHLNDTIKAHTGRNATELIHERIVLEAKRALFHTELSVKEIGYQLGFDDAPYFNRFFKKRSGETPVAFRDLIREKYH